MKIGKLLLMVIFFFSVTFLYPKPSSAVSLSEVFTSSDSVVVKIQEQLEYFFAFKTENKIKVLEKQAERRLSTAQGDAEEGNGERVQNQLQNYLQIKEKQDNLLGKIDSDEVMGTVQERTIEQQKTMEGIKTVVEGDMKWEVVQVQEQVVNQVAKNVIDKNGSEGVTNFLNEVAHVWAPGTGPGGGESGVVIEGGEMKFAPGTSAGGPAGSDIKTVEIKTGGTVSDPVPVQDGSNYAPGTSGNSPGGETANPGINDTRTWIDP